MEVETARPKQKAPVRGQRLFVLLVLVAVLTLVAVGLVLAGPAYATHGNLHILCPDPITEGDTANMVVSKSDGEIRYIWVISSHEGFTASADDYTGYYPERLWDTDGSRRIWIPVRTNEDSEPEHDETFAVGVWHRGEYHECTITIDDDDLPEITDVEISSRPVHGDTYRAGESIDITVSMESEAEVTGNPLVALYVNDGWRGAEYRSGSGTQHLVFRYRVGLHDRDDDGVSVSSASVGDDDQPISGFGGDGQIVVAGTDVPIDYRHGGVEGTEGHMVDGRPYVQRAMVTSAVPGGWDAYRANQVIEITLQFNTDVEVEGHVTAPFLLGNDGENVPAATRFADNLRGSGTDRLVFGYTVQPGDMDTTGIMLAGSQRGNEFEAGGTIKARGTDVEWYTQYDGTPHLANHKVDAISPTVTSVGFESQPRDGEAYGVGETVAVAVRFDENVRVSGDPQLELDVGGVARPATLRSGATGATLVFDYMVTGGDTDTDGIGIGANALRLNGGGIHDGAGNAASLSHAVVVADPDHTVDTSQN